MKYQRWCWHWWFSLCKISLSIDLARSRWNISIIDADADICITPQGFLIEVGQLSENISFFRKHLRPRLLSMQRLYFDFRSRGSCQHWAMTLSRWNIDDITLAGWNIMKTCRHYHFHFHYFTLRHYHCTTFSFSKTLLFSFSYDDILNIFEIRWLLFQRLIDEDEIDYSVCFSR